jgi:uncharacterized protein involved in cysteine biosynthesis
MPDQEQPTFTSDRRRRFTRHFVPHPSYRWLMRYVILGSFAMALVLAVVLWILQRQMFQELIVTGAIEPTAVGLVEFLVTSIFQMSVLMLFFLVVGVGLLCSHLASKITGPIYRLSVDVTEAMSSPDKRVQFRDGDQCQDVAAAVNGLLEARSAPGRHGEGGV